MNKEKTLPILPTNPAPPPQWQQNPHWEALFEAMEDGVCVQSLDARVQLVNRAFAEMMGCPAEELIGKHCSELFGCQPEPALSADNNAPAAASSSCARQLSLARETTISEEIAGRNPGQRLRSRISPVHDSSGQITHFVMVVRDVTDIALREREQARLEQVARLGEMVAGLAHEIKNPLAGIQGAVDILIQRRPTNDPERKVLEDVRHEVNRIDNAMHVLLNRARPRQFNFQPCSLSETVQRAVGLGQAIAASATKGRVKINFSAPADPVVLLIDANQVEDAVLNLILNALDAIEGPGEINISVANDNVHNNHVPYAKVLVSDTGRGIPPENLQRIFNPFFTTNPQGTGLGLPAVRRIMRAHGGRVEVFSTLGQGTSFLLSLPYHQSQTSHPVQPNLPDFTQTSF